MSAAQVSVSEENQKGVFTFDVVFDKEIPKSDVMLWVWDYQRNAQKLLLPEALEVKINESGILSKEQPSSTSEPIPQDTAIDLEPIPQDTAIDLEPLMSLDILKGWAGYSDESVSDAEFLSHVGLVGEDIPSWFKQNTPRWIMDGQISQQEFVNALDYLVR